VSVSWITSTLQESCDMYQPATITSKELVPDGPYPVYGANGVIGRYDRFNHEEPQLLITCRGATCGSINVSEPRSWITGNSMVIRPKTQAIDLRFLEYQLRGGVDLGAAITGAAQPQITRTNLNPITVQYPSSVQEQHRIVTILDEAFEGIATAKAHAEQNLVNAAEVFAQHREILLTQNAGWAEAELSALCDIKHGYAFEGEYFAGQGDHVLLTPGSFNEAGGFRERGDKTKYFTGPIPPAFVLDEGDLLVAMTEQAAGLLGSPLLVPESGRHLHNQRLGRVVTKPGVPWLNEFFFHVFNLRRVRKEIHDSGSGAKVRHTSPGKIGAVRVRYPQSIAEQRAVADHLVELDVECQRLAGAYQRKLTALTELQQSLLHQAFTGQF
jgi:type I restriction enzyme S subunit